MRLFIIGNGFDIHHHIHSSLDAFRDWLMTTYGVTQEDILHFDDFPPAHQTNYRNLDVYDEKGIATLFLKLVDNAAGLCWKDFEESLGSLDWESLLSELPVQVDREGDEVPSWTGDFLEQAASAYYDECHFLNAFFVNWIKSLDMLGVRPYKSFQKLCDPKTDLFLSFNYTETLESFYGAQHVCHIHGDATQSDNLIIGHAPIDWQGRDDETWFAANQYIKKIYDHFEKDTRGAISANSDFFAQCADVDEIYIYGLSCSNADVPYLKEIFSKAKKNVKVYLNSHEKEERFRQTEAIGDAGYEGQILLMNELA